MLNSLAINPAAPAMTARDANVRPSRPAPASPFSWAFLRAYAVTMRPYLFFVSGITGIAGMALAPTVPWPAALLLGLVFFFSYGFGQALTDCDQMDTDSISAPYRPLVQGVVRVRDVRLASLAGLGVSAGVFAWCEWRSLPLAALAVAGLATYTFFKRRWWAGPCYNAWIVAVVGLLGYVCAAGAGHVTPRPSAALVFTLLAVFFGYGNFVLTGYYKDLTADRRTGYHTLPVAYGFQASAWASDGLALLQLLAVGGALDQATVGWTPWTLFPAAFGLAGLFAALLAQVRLHQVRDETQAHRAITPVVHGYILLLAAVATASQPAWGPVLVLFYLSFVWVLKRRPMREQI